MSNYKIPRKQLYDKPGYSVEARRGMKWGDIIRWDPTGWQSMAADDPNEPLTIMSPLGWRGSQKYPFGRPWPEWFGMSGYNMERKVMPIFIGIMVFAVIGLLFSAGGGDKRTYMT